MPSRFKEETHKELLYDTEDQPGWTIERTIEAIGEDIDPEIRGFVEALLSLGYPTDTSCAGGPGHVTQEGGLGFVTINQSLDTNEKKEIRELAKDFGLSGISTRNIGEEGSIITFVPIGNKYKWLLG